MTNPSEVVATGTNVDPSARMQRIDTPIVSPGSCAVCGKNQHPEGFLDPRLDFEFFGTLYFCGDCVGDIARTFGYISPADLTRVREHIAAQDLELNTLRQAVLGLESTVDGLIADAHRRTTQRADDIERSRKPIGDDGSFLDPVDESDEGPTGQDVGVSTPTPVSSEQRPAEQGNQQGRNDVFDTSSADDLLGL